MWIASPGSERKCSFFCTHRGVWEHKRTLLVEGWWIARTFPDRLETTAIPNRIRSLPAGALPRPPRPAPGPRSHTQVGVGAGCGLPGDAGGAVDRMDQGEYDHKDRGALCDRSHLSDSEGVTQLMGHRSPSQTQIAPKT